MMWEGEGKVGTRLAYTYTKPSSHSLNCTCPQCIGLNKEVIKHTMSYNQLDSIGPDSKLLEILVSKGMPLQLNSQGRIMPTRGAFSWTDSGMYREFVWIGEREPVSSFELEKEIENLLDPSKELNSLPDDLAKAYAQGLESLNEGRESAGFDPLTGQAVKQVVKRRTKSYPDDNEPQRSIDLTHED